MFASAIPQLVRAIARRLGPLVSVNVFFAASVHAQQFLSCVQQSAEAAGLPKPEKVHITHMGCYSVRNVAGSGTAILHSHGCALDIGAIVFKPGGYKVS